MRIWAMGSLFMPFWWNRVVKTKELPRMVFVMIP